MKPRSKLLVGLLLAAGMQFASLSAQAEDDEIASGVYLGIDGGLGWADAAIYSDCYYYYSCYYTAPVEYDTGYVAALKIGWASGKLGIGRIRVEFEAGYRRNDADTIALYGALPVAANGSITAKTYMLNVMYDFKVGERFMPYVGLGIGAANVDAGTICGVTGPTDCISGGSTEFAMQLILGAALNLTPKASLTTDLRFLGAPSVTFNYGFNCTTAGTGCSLNGATQVDYYSTALTVGVRFIF